MKKITKGLVSLLVSGFICVSAASNAVAQNQHQSGHVGNVMTSTATEDMSFTVSFEDGMLVDYCSADRVYITPAQISSLEQRKACFTMALTAMTSGMLFDVVINIDDATATDVNCVVSPSTSQPCAIRK